MAHVKIFLSTVSAEFCSYREALRRDLDRPNVTVKVQEDFIATGTETLDKLDEYIRQCDAVIHLVGDMTGALAQPPSVTVIRQRYPDFAARLPPLAPHLNPDAPVLSYTQWEAWLALYHRKVLIIAAPQESAPRDERYRSDEDQHAAQQDHLARLASFERYPEIRFANADRLAVDILRSKLQDILARAGVVTRPVNLPFLSIGELFKGRETRLLELTQSLGPVSEHSAAPVVARVLHGTGGVGKTRLALEYAWRRADEYVALLFINAETPERLQHGLATLCAHAILNLPEQAETDEGKQCNAVLRWLREHPGWLLILDNVDSGPAATAVETLLPQLTGGHALVTSRLANWSASVRALQLDVLSPEAATDFLLYRTEAKRRKQIDDLAIARTLAEELGYLALALEQAGAYIAHRRLGFAHYLAEWQGQRDKVLAWIDARLMQYPKSVAVTWQTSFDQLGGPARRLLQHLAWLGPERIPESLLNVPVPEVDAAEADLFSALAEVDSYSLVTRAADAPSFNVHRLIQEVTRRSLREDTAHAALTEALNWINTAFVGDPQDPGNWPVLGLLEPHARAVATHADAAGIPEPTAQLMNEAGTLLLARALYNQAEPLYARALAIREKELGPEHPDVAQCLDLLGWLYRQLGQYAKAEALYQRSLAIREKALGLEHPNVATSLWKLAELYPTLGQYAKAEAICERSLAIREKALGPEHPDVADSLDLLGLLYRFQGQYAKAEPICQRSLAIREKALGSEHPAVAVSLNNLAGLYQYQKQYAKAELICERLVAIQEKALGPEHVILAASLNNLGRIYTLQGQHAKAEIIFQRSVAIREKVLGAEHPDVANSLNNLAELYRLQGQYAKAEPLYQRSLAIWEKGLGPEHPHAATFLENYARLLREMGRPEDAALLESRGRAFRAKQQ